MLLFELFILAKQDYASVTLSTVTKSKTKWLFLVY